MNLLKIVQECVKEGVIDAINKQSLLNFERISDQRALILAEYCKAEPVEPDLKQENVIKLKLLLEIQAEMSGSITDYHYEIVDRMIAEIQQKAPNAKPTL